MPITRKEANEFLRKTKLRYGSSSVDPTVDSDYEHVDLFSEELPISLEKEYQIAERIGSRHGLKLIHQDFSPGEKGELTKYEPVYASTCKSLNELRKAPETIAKAIAELEKELEIS